VGMNGSSRACHSSLCSLSYLNFTGRNIAVILGISSSGSSSYIMAKLRIEGDRDRADSEGLEEGTWRPPLKSRDRAEATDAREAANGAVLIGAYSGSTDSLAISADFSQEISWHYTGSAI
jgi:hypothetical protein